MSLPKISTAIPHRRYRFGEFMVTVLGDIASPDTVDYRYLMAFIKDGEQQPSTYVSCERAVGEHAKQGRYQIRVINRTLNEVMDASNDFAQLDAFCHQGLELGRQLLALQDEEAYQVS